MSTILITVDALGANHLGQYGYERNTMPVLDRLVDEGTIFENAYANGPYTRISIPALHSSVRLGHVDPKSVSTVGKELDTAGVTTACIGTRTGFKSAEGDLHFGTYVTLGRDEYHEESTPDVPLDDVRDYIFSTVNDLLESHPNLHYPAKEAYYALPKSVRGDGFSYKGYTSAEEVTETAVDWLTENGDEEFFLWLHYMEGHRPYGVHDDDPEYTDAISNDRIRTLMKKGGENPESMTVEEHKLMVDLYDSDLRYCSTHIGRLFDSLQQLGLWDETDIFFTADHGEEFYEHGEFYHRNLPYDVLLHVPLLVRQPGDTPGEITEQRELIDIAPTILDCHDVAQPETFEGTNLFAGDSRDVIATGSQQWDGPVVAGRWDGFKYIYTPDQEFLFDLSANPLEDQNLATERPELCTEFREAIPDRYFSEETKEELRDPEDAVDRERLEALGYLEVKD